MGTRRKRLSKDMPVGVWGDLNDWYNTLRARTQELAIDLDHTFDHSDRHDLSGKGGVTRQQIVDIYETAYSELAESFHGHLEHINDLDIEVTGLLHTKTRLDEYAKHLRERLDTTQRQVNGLLAVIEKETPPEIYHDQD